MVCGQPRIGKRILPQSPGMGQTGQNTECLRCNYPHHRNCFCYTSYHRIVLSSDRGPHNLKSSREDEIAPCSPTNHRPALADTYLSVALRYRNRGNRNPRFSLFHIFLKKHTVNLYDLSRFSCLSVLELSSFKILRFRSG